MNLKNKIFYLLDSGLSKNFISSLNESKINLLFEKMSKKENKEQVDPKVKEISKTVKSYTIEPGGKTNIGGIDIENVGGKTVATPITEKSELDEKFESKAQQGLFWAKCNKCKSDDCKWCKMAKEFSKSTSKKQYDTMPEKKHPKKTVKYKKKETNEEFTMKNYFDKLSSVYTNNMKEKLTKENITQKKLEQIIENNLQPTMKKKDLIRLIENQMLKKKLNEDFYFDGEMGESAVIDSPIEKIKTTPDTESETESDLGTPEFCLILKDCNSNNKFFLPISEAESKKEVYMINTKKGKRCAKVVGQGDEVPNCSKKKSFTDCEKCDSSLNQDDGRTKTKFGLDTSTDTGKGEGGYREIGNPFEKMDIHKNIDPNEKMLPQGPHRKHKPMMGGITESFKKELNKINEILNRRNRYNNF